MIRTLQRSSAPSDEPLKDLRTPDGARVEQWEGPEIDAAMRELARIGLVERVNP